MNGFRALLAGLVLRPLIREKGRSLLTVFGIAAGVAVLVAIQLSNQSALRSFRESVDAVAGRANYQIVSDAGALDERVLLSLQKLWAAGGRFAPVIDLEGLLEPSGLPIRILAVDLLSDLHFRDYRYARLGTGPPDVAGRKESGSPREVARLLELFRDDSVVLPSAFASQHRVKVGSAITIQANGRRARLIVRGLLEPEGPATAFNGSVAVMDIGGAQKAFNFRGKLSRIDLLIPEDSAGLSVRLAQSSLPPGSRLERPSRRNERVEKMLRAFRINLFALSAVSLLVGIFLVYNTVLISILRRRRDVGLLKTLGTSPAQIFLAFVSEGVALGVAGSLVGVALGYGLAWSILGAIGRTINALYVTTRPEQLELSAATALLAIAIGVGVAVLASIQPALEAATIAPGAMIRPGLYQRVSRRGDLALLFLAGAALAGAALASRAPAVSGIALGGYLAVALAVAGFSLLSPFVIRMTTALMAPGFSRFFRMPGRLATASLPASLRRTSIATAALAIAIGMMVAVAIMVGSFRETVRVWVSQTVRSDLWLRPARGLSNSPDAAFPPEIAEALTEIPFIEAFDRFRGRDTVYQDEIIAVGSGDFAVSILHGDLPMSEPRSARKALESAIRTGAVLVSESFSVKFQKRAGDRIELMTRRGPRAFPIAGVYRDYSNDRGVVVMDRAAYLDHYDDPLINTIALFLKEGTDPDAARAELEARLGKRFHAFAFTNSTIRTEVMRIFDQTFLITYALLGVALLVAVLGIVNTLSALILERGREIALLKVLGMSAREIRTMVVLESGVLGVASSALGLVTGYCLSIILIFVINKQSFGWTIELDLPVALLSASIATTFLATLAAAVFPAAVADRVDAVAALKTE